MILMDLQYAPMILYTSQHEVMQANIAEAAREERVGLFSRFSLMRRSIEAGLPAGALVAWDGLHNSAAGYDCVGSALARAIHAAAHLMNQSSPRDDERTGRPRMARMSSWRAASGARKGLAHRSWEVLPAASRCHSLRECNCGAEPCGNCFSRCDRCSQPS